MKNLTIRFLFLLILSIAFSNQIGAQNCDDTVPTIEYDFTGIPGGTILSPDITRNGQCCGANNNVNCVRFLITLDESTGGINFFTPPGQGLGDTYVQFDCGPEIPVNSNTGASICLPPEDDPDNLGPFEIIMCKPGTNPNTLGLQSIPQTSVEPFVETCPNTSVELYIESFDVSSIEITEITSGTPVPTTDAVYNPLTDTLDYTVPAGVENTVLSYQVCGFPDTDIDLGCQNFVIEEVCDTFQISVLPILGCCPDPLSIGLNISADGPLEFCEGGSVILTANNTNGGSILWSTGENTNSIVVSTSGTYDVSVSDTDGCIFNTASNVVVTVNPNPEVPLISPDGPLTFCEGTSVSLTVSNAGASSVLWSTGENTATIIVTASGDFSATVSNEFGCSSQSEIISVVVNPNPSAPLITSGSSTTFCEGDGVNLSIDNPLGHGISWSTGEISESIFVNTTASISVFFTDANGCVSVPTAINTTMLLNPDQPVIESSDADNSVCQGETVTLTSSYADGNTWSTGETSQSIVVSASGLYSLFHVDANECISPTSEVQVTVNPLPAVPVIIADGPVQFCDGGSVNLSIDNSAGNSVLWSNGETTASISVSQSGSFSVTVTDANGCLSSSTTTDVTVFMSPALPVIGSSDADNVICADETITLSSSYADGNNWSTGETTQSIVVSSSGNYSVFYMDANGCQSDPASVDALVNPLPEVPVVSADGPIQFCQGGTVNLSIDNSAGNEILWSNGEITESILVDQNGALSVTVTDANGCSSTSAATVVEVLGCLSIQNACACLNNASGTQDDGQLTDQLVIEGVPNDTWTVSTITGSDNVNAGDSFTESPAGSGVFVLDVTHTDGIGYSISMSNGNFSLDTSNVCYYPDISLAMVPENLCAFDPPVYLENGSAFINGESTDGVGVYEINGLTFTNPLDPEAVGAGNYSLVYNFTSDGTGEIGDAGCTQSLTQNIEIAACDDCLVIDRVCKGNALYVANFSVLWQADAAGPLPFIDDLIFTWEHVDTGEIFVYNGTMYFNPTEIGSYTLTVTSTADPLLLLETCFGRNFEIDEIVDCNDCGE